MRDKLATFWTFTEELARLSTCKRACIGCTIINPDMTEVLAIGYNGPASGMRNNSCRGVEGKCGCAHAEGNAIAKLSAGKDLVMLCTTLQCEHCAALTVNSKKVGAVVYGVEYRDPAGRHLLQNCGILVVSATELAIN
jgi:deoxycytidylate deaminase